MFSKRLQVVSLSVLFSVSALAGTQLNQSKNIADQFAALEKSINGKIGIYAIDTNTNHTLVYKADERFPVQSTFKVIGVGALLDKSDSSHNLLTKKISYTAKDIVSWSPVTRLHVKQGMTLNGLSEAAISYSDDAAINLIMKQLGGPQKVTAFAHSLGNQSFNVSHYEPHLNSNPERIEDTATPKDMAESLKKLTLGNVLSKRNQQEFITWMQNNTTGYKRIRAGVPAGWSVADKTGSGGFGVANDIALMWSPACKPIILAIYTVSYDRNAKWRDDVLAKATSIIFEQFAKSDSCMKGE